MKLRITLNDPEIATGDRAKESLYATEEPFAIVNTALRPVAWALAIQTGVPALIFCEFAKIFPRGPEVSGRSLVRWRGGLYFVRYYYTT
jgi:hypothetical protein